MKYYPLVHSGTKFDAVVLADGDFPSRPLLLELLADASYVVCCDGASTAFVEKGYTPDAIVGDGDSILPEIRSRYASIICQIGEQETNDLNKAFRHCLSLGFRSLCIMGATGKREDHTLGNIALLTDFAEQADVVMLTDHGIFMPIQGDTRFETEPGLQVSVFNQKASVLRSEGLKYPIYPFDSWWQGTLNEACGGEFAVYANGKALVFQSWEKKKSRSS